MPAPEPNMRVAYVDADTGVMLSMDDFYDPGFVNSKGEFIFPKYGCGRLIGQMPEPSTK